MTDQQGITSQQIFKMLMESQYWPPEQMLAYQRSQLEQLLRHAKANVPFYKTRLDCVFRRDGSIDWDRWEEIPIVTREDLRDRREEMQARELPAGHGKIATASSSGSTGVPITISHSRIFTQAAKAAWQRMYMWNEIDMKAIWADYKLPVDGRLPTDPSQPRHVVLDRRLLPEEKLRQLQLNKVEAMADTPNSAEILARVNLVSGAGVRLRHVIGIGMGFMPHQIRLIAESFGAKTVSPYSSKEGSLIAAQCGSTGVHHISSELLHFETFPLLGRSDGASSAIITPFFNTAQPLIRYQQGDLIRMATPCTCGRTLPTIAAIEGRTDMIFRFPGREAAVTGLNFEALRQYLDATFFQIAQVGATDVEIRYSAIADAPSESLGRFTSHFQFALGDDIQLSFKRLPDIPFNAGGKQQRIVREYDP